MTLADELRRCKHCHSDNVVKFGTYKGTQLYWCKSCQRKFKADDQKTSYSETGKPSPTGESIHPLWGIHPKAKG
jgi:transposase-like protein